jgi:hypothetical protein
MKCHCTFCKWIKTSQGVQFRVNFLRNSSEDRDRLLRVRRDKMGFRVLRVKIWLALETISGREIARRLKVSPTTGSKYLKLATA